MWALHEAHIYSLLIPLTSVWLQSEHLKISARKICFFKFVKMTAILVIVLILYKFVYNYLFNTYCLNFSQIGS